LPGGAVLADGARAPTLAETGQRFAALQDAVNAIGDRSGTIMIEPGTYRDCAVQTKGEVAFLAEVPGRRFSTEPFAKARRRWSCAGVDAGGRDDFPEPARR
jgi:hypothetical protein